MKNHDNWSSPFFDNSLWSDTTETFIEPEEDFRTVGYNVFKKRSNSVSDAVNNTTINNPTNIFYVIEFDSGRFDVAHMNPNIICKENEYVILEADRGEDCGKIIGVTDLSKIEQLIQKYENISNEIKPKQIYRLATQEDMLILKNKKSLEASALKLCREKCVEKGYRMTVVDCEYQWDFKKIIFNYHSDDRVVFIELLNELYRKYKIRIWMNSIERSKNKHLKELIQ